MAGDVVNQESVWLNKYEADVNFELIVLTGGNSIDLALENGFDLAGCFERQVSPAEAAQEAAKLLKKLGIDAPSFLAYNVTT